MMLPQESARQITDGVSTTLYFKLQPELFWFKGHFPEQALLPGVTQIHWVMHYGAELFNLPPIFSALDVVKFQRPLFPSEEITLTLNWDEAKSKLSFQYRCGDILASSGRISLCH
ncbi:ApeI family dehydratase [Pragia fontium]|uniref:3-hydroxymyristoyl/3-hydroxydecanoyl-(Acyl carrier protein) dehydratase n=1 Tax=Pragia fontium DSM 5563 = ATCC 49100 TaxID=1122977 RepID=A0AAJ4WD27_9GAMM|nr:hydroxymyristoyl-ACP dehydratase [Pragia fontium]AKJ40701.1 hydroxymyristoyl-ACP dehydratase [Pragia fontium]SFD32346.1 3-hydroxymyristoyl/3-hydroxydecanoyl-(acyl carrier protein) dehydratase [Pragia fontium DSM 5563 = ATCC 49100]VEJ57141.1 Uncharacterised protein [Pragia fontium]